MNFFKQTLLCLCGLTIYVVILFFLVPQAVGESEDQDKLQKEVRARLVFDVAKGFFIVNNFSLYMLSFLLGNRIGIKKSWYGDFYCRILA